MQHPRYSRGKVKRMRRMSSFVLLITLLTLLLSACGSPQTEQQYNQSKAELDKQIASARNSGISDSILQPILNQEKSLRQTSTLPALFAGQSATDPYQNLAKRYQM